MDNIYSILSKIQSEFSVEKKRFNKFAGFHYRNLDDIFETFKSYAKKYNVAVVITDEVILIGTEFFLKATAALVNEKGERIESVAYARHPMAKKGFDEAQLTGMTSSYARKYALNALFAIDDNQEIDEADNTSNSDIKPFAEAKQPQPLVINTPEQVKELETLIKETATEVKNVLKYFKVQSLEYVNYDNCKAMLVKKLGTKNAKN